MAMKLYKYRSLDELSYLEEIVAEGKLYLPKISQLNDCAEIFFNDTNLPIGTWLSLDYISSLSKTHGRVFCLSEAHPDKKNALWERYGDNGQGIAIEFIVLENSKITLTKIQYLDKTFFEAMKSAKKNIHFVKTNEWANEVEYRISISGGIALLNQHEHFAANDLGLMINSVYYTQLSRNHQNFEAFVSLCSEKGVNLIQSQI